MIRFVLTIAQHKPIASTMLTHAKHQVMVALETSILETIPTGPSTSSLSAVSFVQVGAS